MLRQDLPTNLYNIAIILPLIRTILHKVITSILPISQQHTQVTFTCSKTIETLEKGVKYVQS